MKINSTLLFLLIFNFGFISKSLGEGNKIIISPFTPEAITQEIAARDNASAVLHYIFKDKEKARIFFDGIESGEEKWLVLYPIFKSASDAMYSMALDGGLGYGVKNNPKLSLKMIYEGGSQATRVCGTVDEDWTEDEFTEKIIKSALTEVNLRIKATNKLSSEFDYQNILIDCKDALREEKLLWERRLKKVLIVK